MSFIDLILNFAGLLLWLKWLEKDSEITGPRISLVGTLKKTGPRHPRIWFFIALLALLITRPMIYWFLGSASNWVPRLWFGVIPLSFRSDFFWISFLFSFLSFSAALMIFYTCLLLLSILNNKRSEPGPIQSLIREQLGKLDLLPAFLKFLLPWLAMLALWCLFNKPFVNLGILPAPKSFLHAVEQGAIAGLGIYLTWKYLIVAILLLHMLNSYIYFGPWAVWKFIDNSAQQLLKAISWIPLRLGKIDFAPPLAMALVLVIAKYSSRGLVLLYQQLPF